MLGRLAAAIAATVVLISILIVALDADPATTYEALWNGAFGSPFNTGSTFIVGTILVLTALAFALPYTAGLLNVGAEGQMYVGAIASAGVGISLAPSTPVLVAVPVSIAGGLVAGSLWAGIVGALRARAGANEMITSLMLNFVAFALANYAVSVLWPVKGVGQQTQPVIPNARFPELWTGTPLNTAVFVAVIAVAVIWWVMRRTRLGFEIRVTGLSEGAAKQAGIRIPRVTITTFLLAGACAGGAGAVSVLGVNGALYNGFSGSYGFIGIAVALIAKSNALLIVPAALLFAALRVGSDNLFAYAGISPSLGNVMIGSIVLTLMVTGVLRSGTARA
jgi:simple sugar transport system permease protein